MGNANKLVYKNEEYLYYHISRKEYTKIDAILDKHPDLLNKPLTKDTKHTLLMRAAFSACLQSVEYVLNKGANPNIMTPKGQTALTIAISKNQFQIVQLLVLRGADVNMQNNKGLKPVDSAILQGAMQISKLIYERMKPKDLKQSFEYEDLGKKYGYRYVNYKEFLKLLIGDQSAQSQSQNKYLIKQKPQLFDPVPDPRQSWKEWLKRNINFKDAPLVERSSLPPELQPQNRKLGKLDILIHNWVKTDVVKRSHYNPKQGGREVMSQLNDLLDRGKKKEGHTQYQSAI